MAHEINSVTSNANQTKRREPMLDTREVAEWLRIAYRTVHALRKSGELPAIAIAGTWRYDPDDVREFINRQRDQPYVA